MSAIAESFAKVKALGRGGVVPYITAGYPDLATTYDTLLALAKNGATTIELGVPFSDPMADGPVIQQACEVALKNKTRLADVLDMTRQLRAKCDAPVMLFSYLNPLLQYGLEKLAREAKANGVDGVLVTDLPTDAAEAFSQALRKQDVDFITLATPTSTDERLQMMAAHASGFIYAVSRTGVTGARTEISNDAGRLVERIRKHTQLPVALGFGVSTPAQAKEIWGYADAVVIGSALVKLMSDKSTAAAKVGAFMADVQAAQ